MGSNKEKTANDKKRSRKDAKLKKRTVLLGSLFTAILLSVSFFIYGSHVKLNNSALLSYTLLFAVFGLFLFPFLNYCRAVFIDSGNKISDLRKRVGLKKTMLVLVVIIGLLFAIFIAPRLLAQEDVNYVADVCSKSGINSPECSSMQKKRSVSCNQNGLYIECQKDYLVPFPFFY